jgi:defect-in-organelle-trafficking protein DotA
MPFIIGCFFLMLFFSTQLSAQVPLSTALSLAPPPSDISLIYLADIFGTIEGVISSSGSQIFGHMMSVLNLSVMALGSIVIMYTLIVGTLNTAHEGEFLGKHWSSIWLPVRATVGMTLLVPKASGYCLMQVLVMWVVVQGIGAADKLWAAALDYMAMGGKLVETGVSSTSVMSDGSSGNPAYHGAAVILMGQTCAYSIQKQLESLRTSYLDQANPSDGSDPSGPCAPNTLQTGSLLDQFCNNPVPDFLSDMNAINISSKNKEVDTWEMNIPYFSSDTTPDVYKNFSGTCGTVTWANIKSTNASSLNTAQSTLKLNDAQMDSLVYARSIGLQQIIEFLSPVSRAMVDNDPQINKNLTEGDGATSVAFSQYGVTLNSSGDVCTSLGSCQNWGSVPGASQSVLFAGTEMFNSVNAYQGVIQPVLRLLNQPDKEEDDFIQKAKKEGWFFAGAYYFNMMVLNGNAASPSTTMDKKSKLDGSVPYKLDSCDSNSTSNPLCNFLPSSDANRIIDNTNNLIVGIYLSDSKKNVCNAGMNYAFKNPPPSSGYVHGTSDTPYFSDVGCSSTTMGYIGNSYYLVIPGQPSAVGPTFTMPGIQFVNFRAPHMKVDFNSCRPRIKFIFISICMGWLFNGLMSILYIAVSLILEVVMMYFKFILMWNFFPLLYLYFFSLQNAFLYLTEMSHNPIANLATMGASLIETAGNIFLSMSLLSLVVIINPVIGLGILVLLSLTMPLILVWVGYFFTIGFFCAYYVPVYPFIIFTFGAIAWIMAVVEAIVAAPIVALGVMSPEGEGLLGKSETGMMILVNVFLRPSMMIIGYVVGIMLTYVTIWIVNVKFDDVAGYITDSVTSSPTDTKNVERAAVQAGINFDGAFFTQIFGYAAYLGLYVSLYITLVQKSFTLIFSLPDKILRWIGAQQESLGQEIQHWAEESKQKTEQLAQQTEKGWGQSDKSGAAKDLSEKMRTGGKGSVKGE